MAFIFGVSTLRMPCREGARTSRDLWQLASLALLCHHEKSMRRLESPVDAETVRRLAHVTRRLA